LLLGCESRSISETLPKKPAEITTPIDNSQKTNCLNTDLDVTISLLNQKVPFEQDVEIKVDVTNNGKETACFIFRNPNRSFGIWGSYTDIFNAEVDTSMVKYSNPGVIQSQIYSAEELDKHLTYLNVGETLTVTLNIRDLVILKNYQHDLKRGAYTIQTNLLDQQMEELDFSIY
jgi:hypothetical protein